MTNKKFKMGKTNRYVAVILVVISFLIYAIIPFNLCLPFSYCVITGITVTMMAISEIFFWLGGLVIGKEALKKFGIRYFLSKKRKEGEEK